MSDGDSYRTWKTSYLISALAVLVIGGGLGFLLAGNQIQIPAGFPLPAYVLGLAWAWILMQAIGIAKQAIGFGSNPVPAQLPLGDRASIRDAAAGIKGRSHVAARARHLLTAWSEGLSPDQVVSVAQFQSQQNRNTAYAGLSFGLILLGAAAWQQANVALTVIGLVALALVHMGRQAVDRQGDHYLESRLLSKLPGNLPNTGMTATELAESLSKAVNGTFEKYMPQPDQIAAAIKGPVEAMSRETLAHLENVGRAVGAGYEKLESALSNHAGVMNQSGASMGQGLESVLQNHAAQLQKASETIGAQLGQISEMQQSIDKLLRLQEAVDGTLRAVTTTEEFKETISSLRRHLDDSDKLLREISKPRTIRLVESEQD